ncbi:hypothetical protein [Flammeovirga aprica]|uniref:Uncharacterized protein n=1 Tax=Flammeovirga aprica JL-4 TaxID=694437 RepID=A0A7X9XCA2_9BACT|nr:hypothetical protein [Flammeovirga aprica]NME71545.1 hypothetical protein [Flammeovirga aprica JL-4]
MKKPLLQGRKVYNKKTNNPVRLFIDENSFGTNETAEYFGDGHILIYSCGRVLYDNSKSNLYKNTREYEKDNTRNNDNTLTNFAKELNEIGMNDGPYEISIDLALDLSLTGEMLNAFLNERKKEIRVLKIPLK